MNAAEHFLQDHNLQNSDDIDSLLELASLVRRLIHENQCSDIIRIVRHTAEHSCFEAFTWCMEILQEEFEAESCSLQDFECVIGKSISGYDEFLKRLQVDLSVYENGFETAYDLNGEVESFFNILVYKTRYKNIRLVSSENFDTKDNDYVQYKLSFSKNQKPEGL